MGVMRKPDEGAAGSRFLYDSFDAAQARIEANERVASERWAALEFRLARIEQALERLEKRIWLGLSGAFGVLAAQLLSLFLARL